MMSNKITKASLRLFTNEASIEFISKSLCLIPSTQHVRGEPVSKRSAASGVYTYSVWIFDSRLPDSANIHDHLTSLVELLESKHEALDTIRGRTTAVDIFCMFSSESGQGSAEMDSCLLRRLADQRIDLVIDLYPPS